MAKSVRKQLTDAADLVAILALKNPYVRVDPHGTTFQLDPLELARVSRALDVPRKKIEISEHEYQDRISIHINFNARGVSWAAVIWKEKLDDFYAAMGVDPVKRLTVDPRKLVAASPRRLELFSDEKD